MTKARTLAPPRPLTKRKWCSGKRKCDPEVPMPHMAHWYVGLRSPEPTATPLNDLFAKQTYLRNDLSELGRMLRELDNYTTTTPVAQATLQAIKANLQDTIASLTEELYYLTYPTARTEDTNASGLQD